MFLKSMGLAVFPCVGPKLWSLLASGPQLYSLPQASPLQAVALGPYLFSCQASTLAAPTLHLVSTGATWALAPVRGPAQEAASCPIAVCAYRALSGISEVFSCALMASLSSLTSFPPLLTSRNEFT